MANLPLTIEKFVGHGDEKLTCGVFTKRIGLSDGRVGNLVSVIRLKNEKEEDLLVLLGDLFELVTGKLEGTIGSVLATAKIAAEACGDYLADKQVEADFFNVFFYDDVCYLWRHGAQIKLFVFDGQRFWEIDFESGSGPIKEGQIYLIATEKFLKIFDKERLLAGVEPSEIIDEIATEISSLANQGEMAAVLVKVGKGQEEKLAVPERQEVAREEVATSFKNPILEFLQALAGEIKHLKSGEGKAIWRLRRNIIFLIMVVVVILAASVFWAIKGSKVRKNQRLFEQHLAAATAKYNEGLAVFDLNRARARELLSEADSEAAAAAVIFSGNQKVKELEANITSKLKETENRGEVNFEILAESENPVLALTIAKDLYALSKDVILKINTSDKSVRKITAASGINSGFVFGNWAFLLTDGGVLRLDLAGATSKKIINLSGKDISVFLGNVYILGESQIAKFVPTEGGYTQGNHYLEKEVAFAPKSRMAIDGSIWVTVGKKIDKFTLGKQENFEISGIASPAIGNLGAIYTSPALSNLYVIDSDNSALLVIGKDGVYKKAYQANDFAQTVDMVVDDEESKLFIAVGNKVLVAKLK